jgi:ribonuclease HI
MTETFVKIFTDGACKGNPGPGGWGAILIYGQHVKEIFGGESSTTNNRMELMAAIEALKAVKKSMPIKLYTDSSYLQQGITVWLESWLRSNWKNGKVKNQDLWEQLAELKQQHQIEWLWVRGHNGNVYNERADVLANMGVAEYGGKK